MVDGASLKFLLVYFVGEGLILGYDLLVIPELLSIVLF